MLKLRPIIDQESNILLYNFFFLIINLQLYSSSLKHISNKVKNIELIVNNLLLFTTKITLSEILHRLSLPSSALDWIEPLGTNTYRFVCMGFSRVTRLLNIVANIRTLKILPVNIRWHLTRRLGHRTMEIVCVVLSWRSFGWPVNRSVCWVKSSSVNAIGWFIDCAPGYID